MEAVTAVAPKPEPTVPPSPEFDGETVWSAKPRIRSVGGEDKGDSDGPPEAVASAITSVVTLEDFIAADDAAAATPAPHPPTTPPPPALGTQPSNTILNLLVSRQRLSQKSHRIIIIIPRGRHVRVDIAIVQNDNIIDRRP
mmetsp:Transcript_6502/g.18151  ORF Transcript_6502/g.18151 Transcript_6502/m.18151 type:complete len:141 (-) Transcript_6502:920-1342(-)